MRVATLVVTVLIGLPASSLAPLAGAEPPPSPDLSGYPAVAPEGFVTDGEAYFQTPTGGRPVHLLRQGITGNAPWQGMSRGLRSPRRGQDVRRIVPTTYFCAAAD